MRRHLLDKWQLEMGANCLQNGHTQFKVWAPKAQVLSVVSMKEGQEITQYSMKPTGRGIFELTLSNSLLSPDYFYRIDNQDLRPDPVSRWQPFGIHGPSRVYDPQSFQWNDSTWKGIPLKDYIIYELHIGTFTSEGTCEAIIHKLPYLLQLGVTAIELMPIIEFPGERNWGYDGVCPFAPHHSYGGPIGLKKLINACHEAGLAVILDIVYNHLGPEGNYLDQFGHYFTSRYKTPWGKAINYDGYESDHVRQYYIDNALYWLTEYHIDALRLDAVHAIFDFSAHHILEQIQRAFHSQAKALERQAFIIAESDLNDVRIINSIEQGGYALDAQWNDDFHHSLHVLLHKTQWEYFADFGGISQLAKAIKEGFVYDGQRSEYRKKTFGSTSKQLPGERFVICIQNHDQIGNAGLGKRLGNLINKDQYKLASTLLFCAPNLPLLFMGQEWMATTPFLFFTSYEDEQLGQNVRVGYQKEFHLESSDTFDPQNIDRFLNSKLQWQQLEQSWHHEIYHFYQQLIHLRKTIPCLANCRKDLTQVDFNEEEQWLILRRHDSAQSALTLLANFAQETRTLSTEFSSGEWQLRLTTSDVDMVEPLFTTQETSTRAISLMPWSALLYVRPLA
jgi:maltooligosyltrehalose trehalohydrolase